MQLATILLGFLSIATASARVMPTPEFDLADASAALPPALPTTPLPATTVQKRSACAFFKCMFHWSVEQHQMCVDMKCNHMSKAAAEADWKESKANGWS
jgi:hypothetical protein